MRPSVLLPVPVLMTALVAACGGNSTTDEPFDEPDAYPPLPVGPEVFSPAQVAAAMKTCSEPHGAVQTYSSNEEVFEMLAGSWLFCPDDAGALPWAGAELASNGKFYVLTLDQNGGLVANDGLASSGTWQLQEEGGGYAFTYPMAIYEDWANGAGSLPYVYFEESPLRLDLEYGGDQYYVRLPD